MVYCPARFVLELVGIHEDRFSDVTAHLYHDNLKCSSHSIKNNTILSKCLENICLQNQRIKYHQKCLYKETKLLRKIIPECTKSHRFLKKFPEGMPQTPLGWLRAYGARIRAFGAQFLPHQPRIDGYVSGGDALHQCDVAKKKAKQKLCLKHSIRLY